MPWTVANPPPPAKNWTDEEKKKCVAAGNAVLSDGGSDQDAVFACIRAAGKSTRKKDFVVFKGEAYITDDGESWISLTDLEQFESLTVVERKEDGRYAIRTISTAALEDKEGETFETACIDYDIAQAEMHGDYPEYRVFHKAFFRIGRVEKMYRVGLFAVDEGTSYDDPFSLEVCEKMLENNDGTWKVSRGFKVVEASGYCPKCASGLLLHLKHMVAGFKCPVCKETYLGYKRRLKDVHFRKARTFDVTVTDVPAVQWTSAAAFRDKVMKEYVMTKDQLKKKLLKAGIEEAVIDERLENITEKQLEGFDDVPDAVLLKEFGNDDKPIGGGGATEEVVTLDPDVLEEFAAIAAKQAAYAVKKQLEGLTIEVPDMDLELKELPAVDELREEIAELKELVLSLLKKDEERLKELLNGAPRAARVRIRRFKATEEDDEEMDEDGNPCPPGKKKKKVIEKQLDRIPLGDGTVVSSLSEAVLGVQNV